MADVSDQRQPGQTAVEAGALAAMHSDSHPLPPNARRPDGQPGERNAKPASTTEAQVGSKPAEAQPPRTVTWYRADGTAVKEKDEKITHLPFDARVGVDPERQKQLDATAHKIFDKATAGKPINFNEIGQVLETIAKDPNLTEKERANVWQSIAERVNDRNSAWSKDGANPFVLNSNRTWRIAHEVFSFQDGYHAGYLNETDDQANRELIRHNLGSTTEDYFSRVGPSAHNDITNEIASRYQIQCLKSYMRGGFQAYADQWNGYFVSHLPQKANDEFAQQIYQNTRWGIFPTADRPAIAKLQTDYFSANRKAAPNTYVPEPVSIKDPADDWTVPTYPPI